MRFLLQQGWGMMSLESELVQAGVGSGVILSPRVSHSPDQLVSHSEEIREFGGAVLFDPQFYYPRTVHERILKFPYWQDFSYDTDNFSEDQARDFCERVVNFQLQSLGASEIILPGTYTNSADSQWREVHSWFAERGFQVSQGLPVYSTLALGPDVVRNRERFDDVIDEVVNFPVSGFYVVIRHPNDSFLVADEDFMFALLDAFLSMAEAHKEVILGYAGQQTLVYAAAGVATLASGNFRNVRYFNPDIFAGPTEEERRRAVWYYDGDMLSEFRLPMLQLAFRRGFRAQFGPPCNYCEALLNSPQPASIAWGEPEAFRHFLSELSRQWLSFRNMSLAQKFERVLEVLNAAQSRLTALQRHGVLLGERSFSECLEPCRAALQAIRADRPDAFGT